MKKNEDKQIKLYFKQFPQGKTIQVDCSIHTNIHLLKIFICKQLKISPLEASVDIYFQSQHPLKATSTLLQNKIPQNCILKIKIKNQNLLNNQSELRKDFQTKKEVLQAGLSLKYYCKNQKCVNYKKDSVRNLGFGIFDVNQQLKKLRCELCPYKSQNIHFPVGYRHTIVKYCIFRIKTIQHIEESIFKQMQGQWIKCKVQKIISRKLTLNDKEIGKVLTVKSI